MAAEIRLFPCLTDNFGYLIHDPASKATASIDAPEAAPIIKALEREGWTLTDILVTHHHGDHVGGIAELKQKYNCRVVAPHDKTAKIPLVDARVSQGDIVKVGNLLARVLETPGHTLDHISYVFDDDKALFAADTLFSIGCGRVFEGTYPMMWDSLLKLRALPDDFRLYCGHEYTAANVKFALTIEPNNPDLKARAEEVTRLRAAGKPTIPTLLGDEKKANVFLRADEPVGRSQRASEGRERRGGVRRIARTQKQILMVQAPTAADIIARLDLKPHPEGGHFRETFRDPRLDADGRSVSTAIYFLLARGERSHWHRIDAVEVWHYYAGSPLTLEIADGDGRRVVTLGPDLAAGEVPQAIVPAQAWQAAESTGDWTLVGCTVAPGFDFATFELAPKDWTP